MNFNIIINLCLAVIFMASCANKNVTETTSTNDAVQNVANTFSAEAVADSMCKCMEDTMKETADKKTMNIAALQRQCEKQGLVEFGNFKNDATKVANVNTLIKEKCGNLAAANVTPLQSQAQAAQEETTQQKQKKQMADFKEQKTKKPEPKRNKSSEKKPKVEAEIE